MGNFGGCRGAGKAPPPRSPGWAEELDRWLDRAWTADPGGERGVVFLERLRAKVESDPVAGRLLMERVLGGPIFATLREKPCGSLPVGVLGRMTQTLLGAGTPLVEMPAHIVHKQQGRWKRGTDHSDLRADEYALLPRLIEEPQLVMRYQPEAPRSPEELARRLNLVSEVGGTYFNVVVVRFLGDEKKIGLISFHRIDGGRPYLERMVRKAESRSDGQQVFLDSLPRWE